MTDGDINSGKVASVMGDEQTHSEKADSGMDDDSQHSNESNTQQSVGTSNDSEDDDDDVVVRRPPKIKNVFNSDIFDAEEDSDDDDNTTPKDDRGSENNDKTEQRDSDDSENEDISTQRDSGDESASDSDKSNNDSDEGFNENDIDPKLLKKLKKGASKKPTSQRRAAQESLMAIHSETQRIVRESRVNLPYHQPEPKPLSAFLERASKKRESYRTVLHSRDIHKAKAMQDVFEKTRLQAKSQKAPAIVVPEEKRKDEDCDDEKTESLSKCTCPQEAESKSDLLSQDDLPDISSETQSCEMSKNTCKKCTKERDNLCEPTSSKTSDENMEVQTEEQNVSKECEESESNTQSNIDSSTSAISKETPVSEPYSALSDDEGETEIRNKNEEGEISSAKNDSEHSQIENHKDNESVDTDKNNAENEGSLLRLKKSLLLAKLPELSAPPMLSGGPDTFIDFDTDSSDMKYVKPGVNKLMDRFMKHSQKKKKHTPKDVDISIIEKEKSGEHEELKMKSFTYHPTEEDENSLSQLDAPGAKLTALKEKLKVSMKKRREEARKQRQDMYDLDNEEGGYSDGEDAEKILDDDAEMSDKSDTDVEDDEYDEQFEDYEEEGEEEEKENNPFADDEAEESDNDKVGDDKEDDEDDEMELRMQLSDDDDENEDSNIIAPKSKRLQLSAKKKCRALQISDDEEDSKEASRHASSKAQEEKEEAKEESANNMKEASRGKVEEEGTGVEFEGRRLSESIDNDEDDFIPFSKHLSSAQYPARRKSSSLVLPIENSQDLYGSTQSLAQLPLDTQKESQSFNFSLEESQSQMLDADGFLKVGSTAKKSNKPLNFGSCNIPDTQDNMDELLGLCSGRFAGEGGEKKAVKNLFGQGTQVTQDNMGELLGLCSGKFTDSASQDESSRGLGKKRKLSEDDDAESNLSLQLESDDEAKSTKDALSDDDEDDAQKDSEDEDPEEDDQNSRGADLQQKKFKGFTVGNKHGKIRKDFVEQEAELSGSEYDSDENLDLAEDEDVLEMEEGDKDAVGTEEELRNQVGRAHLKQVIDDDKKQLLRFQEMYLPDGDLHSEGGGRVRRFAWSGVDDNTMQDMFDNDSDAENQEEEEQDAAWRKDRFEREKFLQEQQENEPQDSEDSLFLKLGKVFLKRRDSDTGSNKKVPTPVQIPTVKATTKATGTLTSGLKLTTSRRGSFLSRDKNTLAKIAETTKAAVNPNGVKNSRNFVFQVISPDKDSDSQAMPAPKGTKIRKALKPRTDQPAAKKQRLEKDSSFSQHSIFQHL